MVNIVKETLNLHILHKSDYFCVSGCFPESINHFRKKSETNFRFSGSVKAGPPCGASSNRERWIWLWLFFCR